MPAQPDLAEPPPDLMGGILDALDTGVVVLDDGGRVLVWNDWMRAHTGMSSQETLGRALTDIVPSLRETRLPEAIQDSLQSGTASVLTHSLSPGLLPLHGRSGQALLHNVVVRGITRDGAQPGRNACLLQVSNVTALVERERVLRERQNARYRAVVDNALDAMITTTADGTIQWMNTAAQQQFGYLDEDAIGHSIDLLFPEFDWRTILGGISNPGQSVRNIELAGRQRDGSQTFMELSAVAWESEGRTFITGICRDVNERRKVEEARQRFNEELERCVAERTADRDRMWRLSTDIMLSARYDGAITAVNPAWHSVLGLDETALTGRDFLSFVHPDDRAATLAELHHMTAEHSTVRFVNRYRHQDSSYRWIAWTAVPESGFVHVMGRDITVEKEAAEALRLTEEALRQSQKMEAVGQLTGGIAHDFNNLLTGIVGSLELLQTRVAQGRVKDLDRYLNAAQGAASRAAALTHRLLAFARRQTLDPRPTNVNKLIAGMEDLVRRTVGPAITLETVLAGGLWPTLCDPNQLENALLNLCINARDAMPDSGRLTIETANSWLDERAAAQRDLVPGQYVALCVTDTGSGMTPEVIARAFDPFFTTKPIGQGTGLGLSMIYGFARQSGGQVKIYSEIGQGTTVKLYLPRHWQDEEREEPRNMLSTAPRAEAGETVLVVDDEPTLRMLVSEVLGELGYAYVEAGDGPSALRMLQSDLRIDLLITDVGLPGGMNGRQLADAARVKRPGLKVLFITGYAENAAIGNGLLERGMQLLTKPFAMDALAAKVRGLIGAARKVAGP